MLEILFFFLFSNGSAGSTRKNPKKKIKKNKESEHEQQSSPFFFGSLLLIATNDRIRNAFVLCWLSYFREILRNSISIPVDSFLLLSFLLCIGVLGMDDVHSFEYFALSFFFHVHIIIHLSDLRAFFSSYLLSVPHISQGPAQLI